MDTGSALDATSSADPVLQKPLDRDPLEETPPSPGVAASTLPPLPGPEARALGATLGVTATIAHWLLLRGFDGSERTQRFLEPRLSHLTSPDAMVDRAAAADRLAAAIRGRQRICVFGDYDCDGITSAAITTEALRTLGGEVVPLLANRFDGGYGVSSQATQRIAATRAEVLVTCDCGSSDHESLSALKARGVDIIVIDHHLVPDAPLPAVAFLNPHRRECGFPYKGLASCGLALSIAAALRAALGKKLDIRQWLDLVAVGTVADVAPLDGDNRAMVRAGLALLRSAPRPGLRALMELAKMDGLAPITGEDVAFRIAPRLNAPGRLGAPDIALQLLLARTNETARALAAEVEQISLQRRALQETMCAEAIEEIERERWHERPAIVVGKPGFHPGIVGIVAGRLADRFALPVVVVGFDGGAVGRGSVRGPAGVRLYDALTRVSGHLERFGGHQAAAGLEVRADKLAALRDAFEAAVSDMGHIREGGVAQTIRLSPDDDPARVIADLERLEPCGHQNPAPLFVVEGHIAEARKVKGGHLKLNLALPHGRRLGAFGIAMGDRAEGLRGAATLVGKLRRDTYRGGDAVELRVERVL